MSGGKTVRNLLFTLWVQSTQHIAKSISFRFYATAEKERRKGDAKKAAKT
jgi:hypothetical protein